METTKQISPQQKWNNKNIEKTRTASRELYNRNKHDPVFLNKRNEAVKKCYRAKKEREKILKIEIANDLINKEVERRVGIIKEDLTKNIKGEFNNIVNTLINKRA